MDIDNKFDKLYTLFSNYPVMNQRCAYCYGSEGLEYFQTTPVREIEIKKAKELLYETWDHWENAEVLKYYLPRILEIMFPPYSVLEMYPGHFLNTLNNHKFSGWPLAEKESVFAVLAECKNHFHEYDTEDWQEWEVELARAKA